MKLRLCDNQPACSFKEIAGNPGAEDYQNLSKIANTAVENLTAENSSLLIFPKILGQYKDGIEEERIINLYGDARDLSKVKISTGNLMGFIGVGDTKLEICSRFSKADGHDYFMHYLLQKVFSINLFDYQYNSGDNGELNLLLFTFPLLLKKALAQGIFKTYQTFKRNDANIKGVIDVNRHLRFNVPFNGKIAYNSRERTFDNVITELIRHTIEYIRSQPFGKAVLNCDAETRKCIAEIIEVTPSYNSRAREKIISDNLTPLNHAYFTAYKPLQKLCLAILRHKKTGYSEYADKIYGILFDGAWLWEEYLWTVLKNCGFKHPENKKNQHGLNIYKGRICYPDFYLGNQIEAADKQQVFEQATSNFVLDAKYKRAGYENKDEDIKSAIQRADLQQLITYMHILPASEGGLIYPYDGDNSQNLLISEARNLYGFGGMVQTYGVKIPQKASDARDFRQQIMQIEETLQEYFRGRK